jgi:hypothetical protein
MHGARMPTPPHAALLLHSPHLPCPADILMDPVFEEAREEFCRSHCAQFEDNEENKVGVFLSPALIVPLELWNGLWPPASDACVWRIRDAGRTLRMQLGTRTHPRAHAMGPASPSMADCSNLISIALS